MEKNQLVQFLKAIDEALAKHAARHETLDMYLIGRAAMIARYGLVLSTRDVDIVAPMGTPELETKALELFGEGTPNAKKWGLYLQGVPPALPPIPGSYCPRSRNIPGDWKVLRPKYPMPDDLAITKLRRFHAGDREDLQILCDSGELNRQDLERALASAYPFGMDEDEDPSCKRVNENFRRLIDYVEGRSRNL